MNNGQKSLSINETFIVESIDNAEILSACTALYSNSIVSCSGNTAILLENDVISFNGNILAPVVSGGTFYGDGSHLTGISTQDTYVTGGTYSNGIATFTNNTGGTFSVSGFYTGYTAPTDVFVTGATYSAGTAVFTNNTGGTFSVSGFSTSTATAFTGGTVTGATFFSGGLSATTLSATTISATTFYGDGSHLSGVVTTIPTLQIVTDQPSGNTTTNPIIQTNGSNLRAVLNNDGSAATLSFFDTNVYPYSEHGVYGGYGFQLNDQYGEAAGLLTLIDSTNDNIGFQFQRKNGTIDIKLQSNFGDVFGESQTVFWPKGNNVDNIAKVLPLSVNKLFADEYGNILLPIVTGGTYSNGTAIFRNTTGGTFSVSGFYTGFTGGVVSGLTATTISATTYQNLPLDIRVTGGTYYDGVTTFKNNSGGTFNVIGPSNYNAGVIYNAENWVDNGNGSINLPAIKVALFNNPDYVEPLMIYSIASGTTGVGGIPPLNNNDTNYIIIEYNNGSPRYNVLDNDGTVNGSSIVLFMIVYRANNFVHTLEFSNMGAGLPNKLNNRVIATDRFARESGCSLSLSGNTGVVDLSSGVVWNGPNRQTVNAVTSNGLFFKNFHSGGTWVYTTSGHTVNNNFYDNGTNLVAATPSKYLVNWYFRGQEINDHLYEVISYGQFDSIQLAEASTEPNLPELITSHAFLVGRIIIGVGETTGITQSAFVTVFQPSGAPALHNDLSGIQGGVAGEYYHLDSNKYNNLALTNTDNNFSAQQTFNNGIVTNNISATTYENLPLDITVTGGTYSNGTATFENNSGGTFSVTGFNDVFVRNETNPSVTNTITINQSIFNPSDLIVLNSSIFIIDTNADYYVLGDLTNNGVIVVNGTLKIGGELYNYGTITGSGIIE